MSVRQWVCSACGANLDRDVNAAVNTLKAALGSSVESCSSSVRNLREIRRSIPVADAMGDADFMKIDLNNPPCAYDLIYSDPPWRYDFSSTKNRQIENHYPTMTVDDICKLSIPSAKNCVLYLWATAPKLPEALKVVDAWGFKYVTNSVWDKQKVGMGYWFRGQHELLIVATKGHISPPKPSLRVSSVYSKARDKHSKKPNYYRFMLDKWFPSYKKLEMFARDAYGDWDVWGNEAPEHSTKPIKLF